MTTPKLVIDNNVYLSASQGSAKALMLLSLVRSGAAIAIASNKLHLEFEESLEKPSVAPYLRPNALRLVRRFLDAYCSVRSDATLRSPIPLCHDRDDDYIVALAQRCGAAVVTGDLKLLKSLPPGVPGLSLGDAVAALDAPGGLQVVLAASKAPTLA